MIGDSLSADMKRANNYGIKTCWFDKESKRYRESSRLYGRSFVGNKSVSLNILNPSNTK